MKKLMLAAALGLNSVFQPRLPSLTPTTQKQRTFFKKGKNGRLRNITAKIMASRSKYKPHQGKQECARRVKQGLAGMNC